MAVAFLILGLLCLIYCIGIFVAGIYGSWFFLIWGVMGGVFVLLSRVIASGLWAEAPLILRRLVLAAVVLGILFFLFIEGLIVGCFWEKGRSGLDYLVVLGAQMWESGPSKALKLRLDAAYEYLMENENTIVIVSGGQGSNEPISEAQGMYDYLVGRGIAPERIRMEDASTNTVENLRFSRSFIEKEDAAVGIVTNNFHIFRSVRLAKAQGYGNVCGIAAPSDLVMQPNNMLREFFGVMKDWIFGNMQLF